ncbi:MAG: aminotransferase class I/II-fold pyridoxal phosphate-dependent enzyme [Anaerolineales bacterium]
MDLFDKVPLYTRAKEAMEVGMYPYFQALDKSEGAVASFRGKRVIMLGSNNYLGMTTHPRVVQAAMNAVEKYGTSCTGSRYLNGNLAMHDELDRRLAEFVGKEAAVVFPTGYQTNIGTISALVGKKDYIILDKDAHACIVDGAFMSFGELKRFVHNDVASLERVLKSLPEDAGKLVAIDGIYSMGGEIAPLPEIVALCKQYGARLMVDDAHSVGVLAGGRGTAAHFGLTDDVDLITGTFSKSFASVGGFVAGDADVIHYIQHHARALMFSASMPPSNAATVLAVLDVLKDEPQHIERLWENTEFMRAGLKAQGWNIGRSNTPIIPVIIGEDYRTGLAYHALLEAGVYVNPVVSPGVPQGQALLRTSYLASHTTDLLQEALDAFEIVGRNLDLIPEKQTAV